MEYIDKLLNNFEGVGLFLNIYFVEEPFIK